MGQVWLLGACAFEGKQKLIGKEEQVSCMKKTAMKILAIVSALALALALAGCDAMSQMTNKSSSSAASSSSSVASKSSSASASSSSSASSSASESSSSTESEKADEQQPEANEPEQQQEEQQAEEEEYVPGYISTDDAKSAAVSAVGMGLPEQVYTDLVEGGDAPHYAVTLVWGTETRIIDVDAITGEVWPEIADMYYEEDEDFVSDEGWAYISDDDAKSAAVRAAGMGLPEEVYADLVEGGDAPHYVVVLINGDDTRTIEVDAYTGDVWM